MSPRSWLIVSVVIPGQAPYLVRVFLPIQPSHPVLVPALAGTCG